MKTLKAVRYLRVSSEHQVEGTSLRTQYERHHEEREN